MIDETRNQVDQLIKKGFVTVLNKKKPELMIQQEGYKMIERGYLDLAYWP